MLASNINNRGKQEKNAKVKSGECIFPFKYKFEEHNSCIDTNKGAICATEVNPKTKTLTKYGYCQTTSKNSAKSSQKRLKKSTAKNSAKSSQKRLKKGTKKKALSRSQKTNSRKLILNSLIKSSTLNKRSKSSRKSTRSSIKKNRFIQKRVGVGSLKTKRNSKEEMNMAANADEKGYNEDFINVLSELASIMQRQGEPFRARAYQKAQETIMKFDGVITSFKQLEKLPGIGKTILAKLEEYETTGKIVALEKYRNDPINILTNIYGVGPKKAQQLLKEGFDSIDKIKSLSKEEINKLFNANQIKGLEYYDDINQKIPRSEIIEFDKVFEKAVSTCCDVNSKTRYEIVGSYRRGKQISGDIDMIITNEANDASVFDKLLELLKEQNVLEYTFSKGKTKSLTMCRLTPTNPVSRRVDFLYTSPEEYPFAVLYFTGSKIFNTVMRQRALKMGYTLNEHGFSHMRSGIKGAKVDNVFNSEKDIFDFLNMQYKEPNQRIDGRAVQDKIPEQQQPNQPNQPNQTVEAPITDATITGEPAQPVEAAQPVQPEKPKSKTVKIKVRKTLKKPNLKANYTDIVKKFKADGISYLEGLTEKELIDLIIYANDAYYNKTPIFSSDEEYDIVKEFAERKYPNNPQLKAVGAPIEKNKVKLPYNMPSMNKIKPDTNALIKWKNKYNGPYVLSAKLDGVSGMYVLKAGEKKAKLYTRGDGTYGQDVSHLIPYLPLPTSYEQHEELTIRGEFIISKEVFENKYKGQYSNARNLVSGIINSKTIEPEKVKNMDFVIYEVIKPNLLPSKQFDLLKQFENIGLKIVWNELINNSEALTNDVLSDRLTFMRDNYSYEIDGIICADDNIHNRTKDNPEHAFAFKMVLGDQVAEVKVVDVLWSPSKDGYLKPRVQVEPVVLGGAKIEYATGFNAKFIQDNKIGVGAIIKLVRSGDVIPHIMSVIKPAEQAMMPIAEWKWNPTHVDAVLENKSQDETVNIKTITLFFKHLETAGMGPGNVAKIVKSGFSTLPSIIHASESELQAILGKKNGQTVASNIKQSIDSASLPQLMAATNIFGRGFGEKRFITILSDIPDALMQKYSNEQLVDKIGRLKGMSNKSAKEFVDNLPLFILFLNEAKLTDKLHIKIEGKAEKGVENHPLFGKRIVMTGFRDKELTALIESKGGEMGGSVSKNTFVVLVKDKDEDTGKADQARKLNIPLMTPDEFREKYLN